jgi:hypothetical protein
MVRPRHPGPERCTAQLILACLPASRSMPSLLAYRRTGEYIVYGPETPLAHSSGGSRARPDEGTPRNAKRG